MKRLAGLAVFLALGGCGPVSLLSLPKLPPKPLSAAPVAAVPVNPCPADLTADLDPMPKVPDGAFIPAPTDPSQQAGWKVFLDYLGNDYAGYAAEGWRRAAAAKDWCSH